MDRFCRLILVISCLLFSIDSYSQSTPSVSGWRCSTSISADAVGYSDSLAEACSDACAQIGLTFGVFNSVQGCGFLPSDRRATVGTQQIAICLTGFGFQPADSGGFCPDPDDQDGDDEDGDGDICDSGEEKQADCNQPDSDADGDGIPDSEDDDDGKCSSFNDGDADCDGVCGEIDDPDSEDCSGVCLAGKPDFFNIDFMEQFGDGSTPTAIPPDTICSESCDYDRNDNGSGTEPCIDRFIGDEQQGVQCRYTQNGETCSVCTAPECLDNDQPCPSGQQRTGDENQCTEIENFCDIDEHTNGTQDNSPDGIPDNDGTFACGGEAECNPDINSDCLDPDAVGQYSCGQDPPSCNDCDPVAFAIQQASYNEICGTNATDVFDCDEDFLCEGDSFECALLGLEREDFCSIQLTQEQLESQDSLLVFREGIDDGSNWNGGDNVEGSFVDFASLASELDDSGYGFPRVCQLDSSVRAFGRDFNFDFGEACGYLEIFRIFIMLAASLISFFIIRGSF